MAENETKEIYSMIADLKREGMDDPKKIMKKVFKDVNNQVNLDENYPTLDDKRKALGGTKVHALSVQKGGVGKTTISSNLAWTLAKQGYKVLLIDSDPQGSLTELCNIHNPMERPGLQDIYESALSNSKGVPEWDVIESAIVRPTYTRAVQEGMKWVKKDIEFGFDFIPTYITLSDLDIYLARLSNGALFMYKMVSLIKKHADYDYILIDCMPGLGVLTYNAIAASTDGVIVPVNLELMTIVGARNLVNVIRDVQKQLLDLDSSLVHKGIAGFVKNQYTGRRKVTQKYEDILYNFFPIICYSEAAAIPNKASCDAAHDCGRFYAEFDKSVEKYFDELANEVVMLDIFRNNEKATRLVPEISEDISYKVENFGK